MPSRTSSVLSGAEAHAAFAARSLVRNPYAHRLLDSTGVLGTAHALRRLRFHAQGRAFGANIAAPAELQDASLTAPSDTDKNPLERYFDAHVTGPGIWKWRHYFPIYHRHFAKFVGREVNVVEIGVYSGGSMKMWRDYFGPQCRMYGVDIEDTCKVYEDEATRIFIGDQGNPGFWRAFLREVPDIDIIIDDGSHVADHQMATLEALLPQLRLGGVYLCEDIRGDSNPFHDYVAGLARNLHVAGGDNLVATGLCGIVESVHLYPYVTVIERPEAPVQTLTSERAGTEWQPFRGEASGVGINTG
jgi:hypothetical protein